MGIPDRNGDEVHIGDNVIESKSDEGSLIDVLSVRNHWMIPEDIAYCGPPYCHNLGDDFTRGDRDEYWPVLSVIRDSIDLLAL